MTTEEDYKKLWGEYQRSTRIVAELTAKLDERHNGLKNPYDACDLALPILQYLLDKVCDVADEDGVVHTASVVEVYVGATSDENGAVITLNKVGRAREACDFALRAKPEEMKNVDTDEVRDMAEKWYDEVDWDKIIALCDEVDRLRYVERTKSRQRTVRDAK